MNAVLIILSGCLLSGLAWHWSMRSVADASRVALVAVLGVTASAFNVVVPIASVEATTTVVLCTGIALGARMGIAVAIVAIIGSSVAGGLGAWTMWQVVGWSIAALLGAGLGGVSRDRDWFRPVNAVILGSVAALATLVFDVVLTVPTAAMLAPSEAGLQQVVAALLLGAAFTLTHVTFTTALTVLGGPSLLHALSRARPRLDGGRVTNGS